MATEVITLPQLSDVMDNGRTGGNRIGHVMMLKKMPIRIDALKILDPGRKKLTSIETQRIISALDECIRKIELVTLLSYIEGNLERFSVVLGSELMSAIKECYRLETNLCVILGRLEEAEDPYTVHDIFQEKALEPKEDCYSNTTPQHIRSIYILRKAINSSVKNVLRLFQLNPAAYSTVRMESHARNPTSQAMIHALLEMRTFLLEKLLTNPMEDREKIYYVQSMATRNQKNADVIAALEAEVAAATQDKEHEVAQKNDVIRKLKSNLHHIEKLSEDELQRTNQETEKQQKTLQKTSEGKCTKLQHEVQQLRTQLNNLIVEHRELELVLRKKKFKIETEIENWIQKYDADLGEKQEELEQLDAIYKEEKAQLSELQEQYDVMEQEYKQIMEDRRIAQQKKEEAERELANMTRAAIFIQAFWRGYKVRKMLKGKKKGKKGKKGKGKGKQGKK
ncbi:dynein regulatory complex protein 10 [Protopterus annectens]|uniref:dynein regulatory complex protein 10 n=1 Tax=Protopterus annectens TaxID=7888 RepID=UPI001CF942BA|nr:dynein regulatory complex protein 10 [Protopterus annectens]